MRQQVAHAIIMLRCFYIIIGKSIDITNENILNEFKENFRVSKATMLILTINLIILIVLNLFPTLRYFLLPKGNIDYALTKPWTLITVLFSHENILHFLLNMIILYAFGTNLEKIYGSKLVVAVYFIAGIFGSLVIVPIASYMQNEGVIAGASASVLGIAVAFSIMRPNQIILKSKAITWFILLFVFNILSAFIIPNSLASGAAHFAGMIVGLIVGLLMKAKQIIN